MSSTEGQVPGGDGVVPDSYWGEQSTDRMILLSPHAYQMETDQ